MKTELTVTIALALIFHVCTTIWWASNIDARVKMNEHDVLRLIHRVDKLDQEMDKWMLKNMGD